MSTIAVLGQVKADNLVTAGGDVGLQVPGGNGLYAAAGVRLWTGRCQLVGEAPENLPGGWVEELGAACIDTSGIVRLVGFRPDASEWCFYRPDGSRRDYLFASLSSVIAKGAQLPTSPDSRLHLSHKDCVHLERAVAESSFRTPVPRPNPSVRLTPEAAAGRLLHAQCTHLAPGTYELHLAVATRLAAAGRVVSLDPGHYMRGLTGERLAELLSAVTIFSPSEREVLEYKPKWNLERAAREFGKLGPRVVVIKRGAKGALVYDRQAASIEMIPAFPARVMDPTGCGDAFCGGFVSGYIETADVRRAARMGTVAASFEVEGMGALSTIWISRAEADARLEVLRNGK